MTSLFLSPAYADITFVLGRERIPAHRFILGNSCHFFESLLYRDLPAPEHADFTIEDPAVAFKEILRYVYTSHVDLPELQTEHILSTLKLAKDYGLDQLEHMIIRYLRAAISLENVLEIFSNIKTLGLETLSAVCYACIDRHAVDICRSETFVILSADAVGKILERDSFSAPELHIFKAASKWCKFNGDDDEVAHVLSLVRFPLMSFEALVNEVRPTELLDDSILLDAISTKVNNAEHLPVRNAAEESFLARSCQIDSWWSMLRLSGKVLSAKLAEEVTVNHIRVRFRDGLNLRYYMEVSTNRTNWERVVDYTDNDCRSWQYLYFPERRVRYVRWKTLQPIAARDLLAFAAISTTIVPEVVLGMVIPNGNVATEERGATVLQGDCDTKNALLNPGTGYTWHYMQGKEQIMIQLGQPYMIQTIKLFMADDCKYVVSLGYSPQRSSGYQFAHVDGAGVQTINIPRQCVVFIKLQGTTASNGSLTFRCLGIECY